MFICPAKGAAGVTVEEIRRRLAEAGDATHAEQDGDLVWVVLGDEDVTLRFTTVDGLATSAVLEHLGDNVSFIERLERVFNALNWTIGDEDYA